MTRCEVCSDTLDDAEFCILPNCPYKQAAVEGRLDHTSGRIHVTPRAGSVSTVPPTEPVILPAPRRLRLAASAPELLLAVAAEALGAAVVPLGVLVSLGLAAFFAVRDQDGGRWSPGKRLAGVRAVDAETGEAATPTQALVRNVPLVVIFTLAAIPGVEVVAWFLLACFASMELLLAVFGPDRRRIGDWLAGTRVIAGHPDEA